jgi:hypothetical protein
MSTVPDPIPTAQAPDRLPATVIVRRVVISLLALLHLCALALWQLPAPDFLAGFKQSVVTPYMTVTGLEQTWNLFDSAPNPSNDDTYVKARITYKDGSVHLWDLPRNPNPGLFTECERARFRTFEDKISADPTGRLWEGIAAYAARQNYLNRLNPPVQVTLVRHHRWIAPPGMPTEPFTDADFFGMPISAGDLR